METSIQKTSAAYSIEVGSDADKKSVNVNINLVNKEFTIEERIGLLRQAGITFSVGGCKDISLLKDLMKSVNVAVELIEEEFENLRIYEAELAEANAINNGPLITPEDNN